MNRSYHHAHESGGHHGAKRREERSVVAVYPAHCNRRRDVGTLASERRAKVADRLGLPFVVQIRAGATLDVFAMRAIIANNAGIQSE